MASETYLHGHWKVVLGLWREENVDSLLDERLIAGRGSPDFDDVEFPARGSPDGEAEQGRVRGVALHAELDEGSRVALDGLADLSLDGVELHGAHDAVLLGGDADQKEPGTEGTPLETRVFMSWVRCSMIKSPRS